MTLGGGKLIKDIEKHIKDNFVKNETKITLMLITDLASILCGQHSAFKKGGQWVLNLHVR